MLRSCLSILAGLLALATAQAQLVPQATSHANSYAVLIVSRERLEAATSCEIGLFLHDQLTARLSLRAGEVRHYRIARRSVGLYLIATPASL